MAYTFYEMAVKLVGSLPASATWIYTITAILLFFSACAVIVLPIAIILQKVNGG